MIGLFCPTQNGRFCPTLTLDYEYENDYHLIMSEQSPAYLSDEESQLIADFRKLTPKGQKRVIECVIELSIVYPKEKKTRNSSGSVPNE